MIDALSLHGSAHGWEVLVPARDGGAARSEALATDDFSDEMNLHRAV